MKVYGNSKWPTVRWLRNTLAPIPSDQNLAWGIERPNCIGGQPKLFGLNQLFLLKDHEIPVPTFYTSLDEATDALTRGHLIVGRTNNHSQGRFIYFPHNAPNKWLHADYWTAWINEVTAEWRIFCAGSSYLPKARTFAVGKKVLLEETPLPNIRSRRLGWVISFTEKPPKGVRPLARKAVDALGYDFGAVDILQLPSGEFVVLEVNSAFALRSPHTRRRFLQTLLLQNPSESLQSLGEETAEFLETRINEEN
ncbi:MAG: hypothetical protein JRJ69_10390 [Deltaproteobacteria bacterium]|nr:hypothetical protein [Deltaproteobacteria bacterium]